MEKKGDETFLKIYSSEEFDAVETGTMSSCRYSSEGPGYDLGLVRTEKNIFEKKIIQLIESYDKNYERVKEKLNIGPGNDFGLGFVYANGTVVSTEEKEIAGNVFIEEVPIQYISKDSFREAGSLNIKTW